MQKKSSYGGYGDYSGYGGYGSYDGYSVYGGYHYGGYVLNYKHDYCLEEEYHKICKKFDCKYKH